MFHTMNHLVRNENRRYLKFGIYDSFDVWRVRSEYLKVKAPFST